MEKQKNKLTQLTNIRAVAILLVVLGHSIILYSPSWGVYETTRQAPFLAWLKQIINMVQMPLFFSLSGYLFLFTHQKKRGLLSLLKSKTVRLLAPYVFIGCFFLLPLRIAIRYPGLQGKSVVDVAMGFLLGTDVGHLWFLPTLFLIFVLSEIILIAAEKLPGVKRFPAEALLIGAALLYFEGYRFSFGYSPLQSAYWNLIWFALGYDLHARQNLVHTVYACKWIKWLLLALNVVLALYCSTKPAVGLLLGLGLPALYILNAYGAMPEKTCSWTEKISANSFGIYLFHSPLIYITFALIPNAAPVLVVLINFVGFGLAAYGLTNLVRKMKLGFVIGE